MFSIAIYTWLIIRVFQLTRKKPSKVDVVITGLIPSSPDTETKEASGTTVLLYFGQPDTKVPDEQVVKSGYADSNGEFRAQVDHTKVGQTITCRIRHAAYEFMDEPVLIMPHGAIHAAKMRKDDIYREEIRGVDVGDLDRYSLAASRKAEQYRQEAFQQLRYSGFRLSQVPFLYWLRFYFLGIVAFAFDYWIFGSYFEKNVNNIGDALYLSTVTVTTLGYGDIVPVHTFTKFLTGLQAVSGVVLVGLFLNSLFAERTSRF